jgi:hypothetical protein
MLAYPSRSWLIGREFRQCDALHFQASRTRRKTLRNTVICRDAVLSVSIYCYPSRNTARRRVLTLGVA